MAKEEDIFIRDKLQEDNLISKKADDVFNDFFKNTIHRIEISQEPDFTSKEIFKDIQNNSIDNFESDTPISNENNNIEYSSLENSVEVQSNSYENKEQHQDERIENVVSLDEERKKRKGAKRFLSAVASLMIIFLVSNAYAATKGYNNIFFIIRDMFEHQEISDKKEILADEDMTISYQAIEIASGLNIQINRLVAKDNEATLYMNIDETNATIIPVYCIVHDITTANLKLLANQSISIPKFQKRFDEQISLSGMSESTNVLEIEFQSKDFETIAVLNLDLKNKSIDIIQSAAEQELEKISEVELKEYLANFVRIHFYEDNESVVENIHTKQEYRNEEKVIIALEYLANGKEIKSSKIDDVHKVIKEFTGETIEEPLKLSNLIIDYDEKTNSYKYQGTVRGRKALCLDVTDLSFVDGIYTAKFTYCYPTDDDYKNNNIENLQRYSATLNLKINSEYSYSKYLIVDADNFESGIKVNGASSVIKKSNETNSVAKEDANSKLSKNEVEYETKVTKVEVNDNDENNKVSLVQFDSYFYSIDDLAFEYRYCSNIKNYKNFEYDLDGDYQVDKIKILHQKEFIGQNNEYALQLNGETFLDSFDNMNSVIVYVVDLNTEDNSLEIVVFDDGPSDDPSYKIYKKQGSKMILIETIEGYSLFNNKYGKIACLSNRQPWITPFIFRDYYNLIETEIKKYKLDLSNTDNISFSSPNSLFTEDLKNIDKFFKLDDKDYIDIEIDYMQKFHDAGIRELQEYETFKIISFENDIDIKIELDDGTEGYLLGNHFSD